MNYISLSLSIIIFIIILLQVYNPFLNSSSKELNTRFKTYITNIFEKQQAEKDILDIEEQSLITIHDAQGGVDDINASTNTSDTNTLNRRQLVFQSSTLGKSVLNDTFQNNEPNTLALKLLYRPGCIYSAQFMPMWHEIKNSLPNNVITEEVNCDRGDILGNSICSNYNISGVPSLILMVPDSDIPVIFKNNRTYQNIKLWLKQNGIQLKYNPEVEHFDKTGGYVNTEQFNNMTSSEEGHNAAGLVGKVISAEGNIRAPYDALYRAESRVNEHDEYHDVDDDGCPIASFSICKENSVNPGYQIFTHRGQWGCVYPDPNTSINNRFDAAFSTVDHYLHSLPPKMEQVVDDKGHVHLKEVPYTADEKIEQMKKCAVKYSKNIRNFGLCDAEKLNDKYTIKNKIEAGEASLPFDGMNIDEYNDTMKTAEALYTACSL
jgi:hypothetical protein